MRWLFIHREFPGQYLHAVRALVAAGDEVVAIGRSHDPEIGGVRFLAYAPKQAASHAHPYAQEFDLAVHNGLAVARVCEALKVEGFVPDAMIGHSGWGEIFFVKDVWPGRPLLGYCEFFYRATGSDADFDPEFPPPPGAAMHLRMRNTISLVSLDAADKGQSPTRWQRDQYPQLYRSSLEIVHEGIDTDAIAPAADVGPEQTITYCARNLEPYRGFHIFMRALPRILRALPQAHVHIVGGDGVSYGDPPPVATTWRETLLAELGDGLDWNRVQFLGHLPHDRYLTLLRSSAVHVYLTYPFILSWGFIEALSVGCHVIASRTPPVEEVICDGEQGELVDFFDVAGLADRVITAFKAGRNDRLRSAARKIAVERYDLRRVCLPAYLTLLHELAG